MKELIIEKTDTTPAIAFNASTGELKISGRAYSNDMNRFFVDLYSWVDEYLEQPQKNTSIILQLEYYNSSFYKLLFVLIVKCKKVLAQKKHLSIKWRHQKGVTDSHEEAAEISAIVDFPIEFVEYE